MTDIEKFALEVAKALVRVGERIEALDARVKALENMFPVRPAIQVQNALPPVQFYGTAIAAVPAPAYAPLHTAQLPLGF